MKRRGEIAPWFQYCFWKWVEPAKNHITSKPLANADICRCRRSLSSLANEVAIISLYKLATYCLPCPLLAADRWYSLYQLSCVSLARCYPYSYSSGGFNLRGKSLPPGQFVEVRFQFMAWAKYIEELALCSLTLVHTRLQCRVRGARSWRLDTKYSIATRGLPMRSYLMLYPINRYFLTMWWQHDQVSPSPSKFHCLASSHYGLHFTVNVRISFRCSMCCTHNALYPGSSTFKEYGPSLCSNYCFILELQPDIYQKIWIVHILNITRSQ